ncbi:hypothetical protein B0H10DRAFT_2025817 [Mycena sp. CBHHK59/15]|nr:hypothetical protein B0H10DRAFT_2025817 [Mycena sp. CBHHK59/15]
MSFSGIDNEPAAWGTLKQLLKDIAASQQDLRSWSRPCVLVQSSNWNPPAILARVQAVQKEVEKLTSGNETLQMYIDNLTVQMAKRR